MSSTENITFRAANNDDIESLVEFNLAMAAETEGKALDEDVLRAGVSQVINRPQHGFYLVAQDMTTDAIVGSLMVTYEWSDWRNSLFWWIQSVYVLPDYRRRGIYKGLYQSVKTKAKEQGGVCGFRLYVEKENLVAQQTYQRLGMAESHYLMYEEDWLTGNRV
jgi:ribosomal protein S18 acetylase RimI-like enzyme